MSRSRNTGIYCWKKQGLRDNLSCPMHMIPGVWSGVHYIANQKERSARRKSKRLLHIGIEPEPIRHRNSVKYQYY